MNLVPQSSLMVSAELCPVILGTLMVGPATALAPGIPRWDNTDAATAYNPPTAQRDCRRPTGPGLGTTCLPLSLRERLFRTAASGSSCQAAKGLGL